MQQVEIVKQAENGFKLATERQRQLIEQLLQSNRIERKHMQYVMRALQNTVSSYSASKIIAFLVGLIAFKKEYVRPYHLKNGARKSWKQKEVERASAEASGN